MGERAKRALVLQHAPTEGPERVATHLAARGIGLDVRALYDGDPVPGDLPPDQPLIVMGGSMGVGDVHDARFPFLAAEIALLTRLVARDAPVLGICLGSQLLAAAGGARVYPNTRSGPSGAAEPAREVGWGGVDFRSLPNEPTLTGVPPSVPMLHWHGDTFDLPSGAIHLASTPLCRHQAFRLGRRQLGFQFHCEVEAETIPIWVREDADFVYAANGANGGATIVADTGRYYSAARPIWDRLLGNAIDLMLAD
ncbi:MAG TPA: gamma-glutamyl-gamma-aminobutyrate hydrolase family protein [Polyangia bacterium]|nr:gamma-glutamyl-gamma-aminobutyrate hydrolase family protein [Polyangia bacterium]